MGSRFRDNPILTYARRPQPSNHAALSSRQGTPHDRTRTRTALGTPLAVDSTPVSVVLQVGARSGGTLTFKANKSVPRSGFHSARGSSTISTVVIWLSTAAGMHHAR